MGNCKQSSTTAGMDRDKVIIRTSIVGIIANFFLAGFKAFVGLTANSIAVLLDAVNNLSDALSSIITIVGTKLAAKLPDKKHPYGYGRIEYLSAMIVSGIVLYAGITSCVESVKKIIRMIREVFYGYIRFKFFIFRSCDKCCKHTECGAFKREDQKQR